jgi:hypothetical protein
MSPKLTLPRIQAELTMVATYPIWILLYPNGDMIRWTELIKIRWLARSTENAIINLIYSLF